MFFVAYPAHSFRFHRASLVSWVVVTVVWRGGAQVCIAFADSCAKAKNCEGFIGENHR